MNLHRNNQQLMFTDSPNQVSVLPWGSRSPLSVCMYVCTCTCVCVADKRGKSLGESSRACWSILSNYQPIEMWFISQGIISISREPVSGWEGVCAWVCREILVNKLPLTPPFFFFLYPLRLSLSQPVHLYIFHNSPPPSLTLPVLPLSPSYVSPPSTLILSIFPSLHASSIHPLLWFSPVFLPFYSIAPSSPSSPSIQPFPSSLHLSLTAPLWGYHSEALSIRPVNQTKRPTDQLRYFDS